MGGFGAQALQADPPLTVRIAPGDVTLRPGQSQQFTATVVNSANPNSRNGSATVINQAVTWTLSSPVGTVTPGGLYTAPAAVRATVTVRLTARSVADPRSESSVTITIEAPPATPTVAIGVSVTPAQVSLGQGQTQQFAASVTGTTNTAVTWSVSPAVGTVSASGLYTAPAAVTSQQTVLVRAVSVADPSKSATASVTLVPPAPPVVVTVTVTPGTATLTASQTQQLTASVSGTSNTGVTWSVNPQVGTLSTSGSTAVYTAPSNITQSQTVEVAAVSIADGSKVGKAIISLIPAIVVTVSPATVTLSPGQSQQFMASVTGTNNTGVTWSVNPPVGTVNSDGLYVAPTTVNEGQEVTLTAVSLADSSKKATSAINLTPSVGAKGKVLAYCSFSSATAPCEGSDYQVDAIQLDPTGKFGSGLRICKGAGCPGYTMVKLMGVRMSMRRGSVAFWYRQNNNNPAIGPTEIFDTYPGPPFTIQYIKSSVRWSIENAVNGTATTLIVSGHGLSTGDKVRISGVTGEWTGMNGDWDVTKVDDNRFTIPFNSTSLSAYQRGGLLLTSAHIQFQYKGYTDGNLIYGTFQTDRFFAEAGEWHHIIWSWTADRHRVYRNGKLVTTYDMTSPFPYRYNSPHLRIGTAIPGGQQDITVDEFTSYDFDFTEAEALALYRAGAPGAMNPKDPHGVKVIAVWAPGEQKVKVSIDSGNDYEALVNRYVARVNRGGIAIAQKEYTSLRDGFVEDVIALPNFESGTYNVVVTAYRDSAILSTAQSDSYEFTKPFWLGNNYGIDNRVPAPYWDPITRSGPNNLNLKVVHREYTLAGGYGLPVGITSLGKSILARPITLEILQGSTVLAVTPVDLQVTSALDHEVQWQGRAKAGQLAITVNGRMEYDGMMLVSIRLAPAGSSPQNVTAIRLKTTLTNDAAKYVFAVKDQPFYWYEWSVRVPKTVGEFNNNLSGRPTPYNTNNIFSIVFSDDDRGLQIFHNNMAGWVVDESTPWQRFIREADGTVSYRCDLANQAFTLSEPMEVTLGYMATPVKRLPERWRLANGGAYGGTNAPQSDLEYHFDFNLGYGWKTFHLLTSDLYSYKANQTTPGRPHNPIYGKRILPFVNAHVLVPTVPATQQELDVLRAETLNDGWNSAPSRGAADYWAWALHRLLYDSPADVVDGYYIDESYCYLSSASLLAGGYIKPDGTHGVGLNLLGAREKFKRLAKILMGMGKAPNLWFHTTATMYPHMWSHGMMTFDGEESSNYVNSNSPADPDHFDHWNQNNSLLDETATGRGTNLLGIARSSKFGFIPSMWRGINWGGPYFDLQQRRASCLYQMHDMLQQDQTLSWWQPKYDFGIHYPDVVFRGYWDQQTFDTGDPKVKVSYYQRNGAILAYVANFNNTAWSGVLKMTGLSVTGMMDAETRVPLAPTTEGLRLSVDRHDCRVITMTLQ